MVEQEYIIWIIHFPSVPIFDHRGKVSTIDNQERSAYGRVIERQNSPNESVKIVLWLGSLRCGMHGCL